MGPHPGKMWQFVPGSKYMQPVLPGQINGAPYHSSPTQQLPPVYVQNASLEMAQTAMILHSQRISGYTIAPFLTELLEGFDINTPADWVQAEILALNAETSADGR